jgi:hypothetical protein
MMKLHEAAVAYRAAIIDRENKRELSVKLTAEAQAASLARSEAESKAITAHNALVVAAMQPPELPELPTPHIYTPPDGEDIPS